MLVQLFPPDGVLCFKVTIAESIEKRTRYEDGRIQNIVVFEISKARVVVACTKSWTSTWPVCLLPRSSFLTKGQGWHFFSGICFLQFSQSEWCVRNLTSIFSCSCLLTQWVWLGDLDSGAFASVATVGLPVPTLDLAFVSCVYREYCISSLLSLPHSY